MSDAEIRSSLTQHAMLVAWGQFAQHIGLVHELEAVQVHQKCRIHCPQTKVLEFLVAMLAGLPHLEDISRDAHPIDQDAAVARAWGQPAWADYSGVSRCLKALTLDEVTEITQALQRTSQPFLTREIGLAIQQRGCLMYDGDLTGRPVSNTSTSYPQATYGHMGDALHLGYQAALISMHSPTYGRMWLSVSHHPGNMTSHSEAEALVLAAETATGVRPWRRTDLLRQRLREAEDSLHQAECCAEQRQSKYKADCMRLRLLEEQVEMLQSEVQRLEAQQAARSDPERGRSQLVQARTRLTRWQGQHQRQTQRVAQAERNWQRKQTHILLKQQHCATLQARLARFQQDNVDCVSPVRVKVRLDAGFGTWENIALLIEMGYEIYTKPYNQRAAASLRRQVERSTNWVALGDDVEMISAPSIQPATFPYPLDVGIRRVRHGQTVAHSIFLHYGQDRVTDDLPEWLAEYNGRQTIEAGIKEGKGVFQMHHLKVRSLPALALQEAFATFAANFVRWAACWLLTTHRTAPDPWMHEACTSPKTMVQVGAHTSALVDWYPTGCLLRFCDQSIYAGRTLAAGNCTAQLPLLTSENRLPPSF